MHIRCPHCQNPIEIVEDETLTSIACPSCGSQLHLAESAATKSYVGLQQNMGRFRLIERVGMGQFGIVFKAHDPELARTVAVKIPRRDQFDGANEHQFIREARAAAQLKHPNIVSVYEVGREGNSLYIVSEYIAGVNLREWLTGRLPTLRESAKLIISIARAVHHAHEAGVVHRDLKPSNIMLDAADQPHVTDFGLAKRETGEITVTKEGHVLGTPAYMSPEQAAGKSEGADRRSDLYSLGVILYQLLTGELPFRGEERMLLLQIERDEPTSLRKLNSRIPRELETICLKCLEKVPARRYATASDLADEIQRYLDNRPILARPISRVMRGMRWCERNPTVAGLFGAVFGILLAGVLVSGYFAAASSKHARRADAEAADVRSALYDSLVSQIQATRIARQQGYREAVWTLADRARQLTTPAVDVDELRREAVSALGDFVGFEPRILQGFAADITAMTPAHDGTQTLVGCQDGTLYLLNGRTGERRATWAAHREVVVFVAALTDRRHVISADGTGTVHRWRLDSPLDGPEGSFEVGPAACYGASSGVDQLAAARENSIDIWDTMTGQRVKSLPLECGWKLWNIAIDSTESLLAGVCIEATSGKTGLVVWDQETAKEVWRTALDHGDSYPGGIAFSPDSKLLVVGLDQALIVYETSGFQQISFKRLDAIKAVAFDSGGQQLAAIDIRGRVTLWSSSTDRETAVVHNWRSTVSRETLSFSADGSLLASSNANRVSLWQVDAASERRRYAGHESGITCLVFRRDGGELVSGGKDRRVQIWNTKSGALVWALKAKGPVQTLAFSPDERLLAIGGGGEANGSIEIVDMTQHRVLRSVEHSLGDVNCVAFLDRGGQHYLAACGNLGFVIWRLTRRAGDDTSWDLEPVTQQTDKRCLFLSVSPDSRWIAWVRNDREIALWNVDRGSVSELRAPPMNQGWHGLAFLPDSDRLMFISRSGMAELWSVGQNQRVLALGDSGTFSAPHIAVDHHGKWLAGLTAPDVVSIWDLASQKQLCSFRPESNAVWSLAWDRGGEQLAVGLSDGSLVVWSIPSIRAQLARIKLDWNESAMTTK